MSIKENAKPVNSPQILPFPVENQKPKLSIRVDDKDNWVYYRDYYSTVYRSCFDVLRNEEAANDMANNVFIHIIEKLKSDRKFIISYPKTFFSKVARNMSINELKKTKKASENLYKIYHMATDEILNRILGKEGQEQEVLEANIICNGYEKNEAEIIVKAILKEQDETTRKIFFYYYHDNKTYKEIGKIIELSKSAVQKRLKKLEDQVKAALKKVEK